jgi:flagellar motor component MotA
MPRIPFPLALFIPLIMAGLAFGQDPDPHLPPMIVRGPGMDRVPVRSEDEVLKEQWHKANELRQQEVRRDTEKLLQLCTELRDSVQKSQGVLSLDAVKKAEQVEKLARSVKTKMKQSY